MAEFNVEQWARVMDERMERIESHQVKLGRRQRRMVQAVVNGITQTVAKKVALLIGLGVLIGSALGSSGAEVVRALVIRMLTAH